MKLAPIKDVYDLRDFIFDALQGDVRIDELNSTENRVFVQMGGVAFKITVEADPNALVRSSHIEGK